MGISQRCGYLECVREGKQIGVTFFFDCEHPTVKGGMEDGPQGAEGHTSPSAGDFLLFLKVLLYFSMV